MGHIFFQHEFLMESGGEPLYAQINRDLKTKRLNSAANTLTKSVGKQIYDHYDLDVGQPSKVNYQNHNAELADNRTDSAKLQNSTAGDSTIYYKNLNNNNTNTEQNQWV